VVSIGMNVESVVIPMLCSINNQKTSVTFEFVDDGSTDNTLAVVNNFFRENISPNITPVVVSNPKNMGINASRNIGLCNILSVNCPLSVNLRAICCLLS
jgi:glycosyltransferase involved in cell wall biosynthesis